MFKVDLIQNANEIQDFVTNTWRPAKFDSEGKTAYDRNGKPIQNAILSRQMWEMIDSVVISRARQRYGIWTDIVGAGLVQPTTLAEMLSTWTVASERVAAKVTMDLRSRVEADVTDRKHYSVPIPIISTTFSFGRRELLAAAASGASLETFEAGEAAEAVAEKAETMLIDGETGIVVAGNSIPGLRTLTARYTGTADGDFGTISNIYTTFTGAVANMAGERYYGPFRVYIANTQYHEMLAVYSDGTGQTALQRVLQIPQILSITPNDLVAAGEMIFVQMSSNVVDIKQALPLQVRRWNAPDDSEVFFKVLQAGVPRLKTDYAGNSGILHYTGL